MLAAGAVGYGAGTALNYFCGDCFGEFGGCIYEVTHPDPIITNPAPFDGDDLALAEAMQDAWVRFAASSDPNGGNLPTWPVSDVSERYLELDGTLRVGTGWRNAELDFVDDFFARPA